MAVHYEAPFMFLLFGGSRAVLIDTGATPDPQFFPLRRTVDAIIDGWLASQAHPRDYGLLVLHTHSHTDHTAADSQFADRPDTAIVGAKRDAAWPYFGFADEPKAGPGHAEGPQPPAGSLRSAVDDYHAGRLKACPGRASFDSLNGSRGKTSFPELINTARMTRTELAGLRLISLTDPAIDGHTDSAIRSDAGPKVGSRTVTGADLQPVSNLRRWAQDGESVPASEAADGSNGRCDPCTSCRTAWPPAILAQAPPVQAGREDG